MLNLDTKETLDTICQMARAAVRVTDRSTVLGAAFLTAKELAMDGRDEEALYLLRNHPDFGANQMPEPSDREVMDFILSL